MLSNVICYIWRRTKQQKIENILIQHHTFFHNISHSGQVLISILFTRDLQALFAVQGHQLQQWGQTLHPTQQHHHMICRTQYMGQKEAPLVAQALQHALGEDQELAGVLGQLEDVVPPAGHGSNVKAADPSL